MIRALQNNDFTMSTTAYAGTVATDPTPDIGTLGVTRADGSTLIPSGTGAADGGTGVFTYTLTGVEMATLDRLTATWAAGTGTWQTQTEIVGGFLCNLFELKALYPTATDSELADRRTDIEQRLEGACGRAFVPRYERERVRLDRRGRIRLAWGSIRRILTVETEYMTLTPDQILNLDVHWDRGEVWGIPGGQNPDVTIAYEHGWDAPTVPAHNAAMSAMQETYGPNRVDGRIVAKSVDNVSVTYARNTGVGGNSVVEFTSSDVVSFILNNRRPLVG